MNEYLKNILQNKRQEVQLLEKEVADNSAHSLCQILSQATPRKRLLHEALTRPGLSVIAEVKRCSPSAGEIGAIPDPTALATEYHRAGADAVSVLTDSYGFAGSLDDLKHVVNSLPGVAALRKDFIIHELQLAEAVKIGASAALLIVKILEQRTCHFIKTAHHLGLDVIVEVHDHEELALAVDAGAEIIGVNNRNLTTFQVDLATAERLFPKIPQQIITVAESGIQFPQDAICMREIGYDAVLVGQALVTSRAPREFIAQMKGTTNE